MWQGLSWVWPMGLANGSGRWVWPMGLAKWACRLVQRRPALWFTPNTKQCCSSPPHPPQFQLIITWKSAQPTIFFENMAWKVIFLIGDKCMFCIFNAIILAISRICFVMFCILCTLHAISSIFSGISIKGHYLHILHISNHHPINS